MQIFVDGTINPTCLQVGIFLFGKPRLVRQIYPRKKKPHKSKLRRLVKKYFSTYFRSHWKSIVSLVSVKQLRTEVMLGLEDAAATALGTGAVYSIWGHISALAQTYITVEQLAFVVKPIYQKMFFSAKSNCIVKLSVGKTILVLFDFLKEAYRNERTSYLRTYDHSYAKH